DTTGLKLMRDLPEVGRRWCPPQGDCMIKVGASRQLLGTGHRLSDRTEAALTKRLTERPRRLMVTRARPGIRGHQAQKTPHMAGFLLTVRAGRRSDHLGAQERTRTSTVLPAST